jgi:predicted Zn-dependent protease
VIEGGESSIEDMIASCEEPALWITKLHYLGMKHFQTATMTGIAQHGVFLVENGKVTKPVENVRFEEVIKTSSELSEERFLSIFSTAFNGGIVLKPLRGMISGIMNSKAAPIASDH